MFNHETNFDLPELSAELTEKGRFYTTPNGDVYPSVTTVIGHGTDKSFIQRWRDRVGDVEADKVLAQANRRGTAVHEICEQYLKNDPLYKKGHMPVNIANFLDMKPHLDKHITTVGGLEIPLYSDKFRVAGRVDCLAKWDNEWAIVDFKTSRRVKKHEEIHGYFMQASCYAYMVYERTNVVPKNIVIVMSVDDSDSLVFIEKARDWLPKFVVVRNSVDL